MSFLGLRCSGTQFENLLGPRGSQTTTGWKEGARAYSVRLCLSFLILSDPQPRGPSTVCSLPPCTTWNGRTSDGAYHHLTALISVLPGQTHQAGCCTFNLIPRENAMVLRLLGAPGRQGIMVQTQFNFDIVPVCFLFLGTDDRH